MPRRPLTAVFREEKGREGKKPWGKEEKWEVMGEQTSGALVVLVIWVSGIAMYSKHILTENMRSKL